MNHFKIEVHTPAICPIPISVKKQIIAAVEEICRENLPKPRIDHSRI